MPTAEARVAAEPLDAITSACHDPYREAWTELEQRVAKPLLAAMGTAKRALEGAEREASEQLEHDPIRLLAEYRRAIDSNVLEPLIRTAQHVVPAEHIDRVFRDAHEEAIGAAGRLPAAVGLAWGPDALTARSTDGVLRAAFKPLARMFSPARRADGTREAPVRAVALAHLRERVLPDQNRRAALAMRAWAEWFARLEEGWTEWGNAALPILTAPQWAGAEEEAWDEVLSAGRALAAALEALGSDPPHAGVAEEAIIALDRGHAGAEGDLGVAGTALFRPGPTPVPPLEDLGRAAALWGAWSAQSLARLELQRATLGMLSGTYGVQERLGARLRKATLASRSELDEVANELMTLTKEWEALSGPKDLRARLASARERAAALATRAGEIAPRSLDVVQASNQLADSTVEALQGMMRQVPSELVVRARAGKPGGPRPPEGRPIALQELTRQAFDALRVERVRSAIMRMPDRYQKLRASIDGLPEVIAFGFDAAVEELDSEPDGQEGRAAAMAAEALRRAAETVRDAPAAIEAAIAETREEVAEEITDGCDGILERAGARGVQAQLLAAQSRASELWLSAVERATPSLRLARLRLGQLWSRVKSLVALGLQRGSRIVGTDVKSRAARPLQHIGNAASLGDGIPLVYRKLFSPEPVSDPALLIGRTDLVEEAVARWQPGSGVDRIPLLVRGRPGTGISSFLSALAARILEAGGKVAQTEPPARVRNEAELVALVSELLDLEGCASMDELARRVLRAPADSLPDAVVIGALEYLYLRVPGGTDLLERMLTFMAETEPRIFWVGGITTSSWQFVSKAEPTAVSQVDSIDLAPLSPEQLRTAIMARHRRSGLGVHFEEPTEGRRLLQRRLRRLRGTDRHQQVLEVDFFDRLSRASEGTVGLALHQWLATADFTWREGHVLIRPLSMPDFSVLGMLQLTQSFTLKALLEHRTLTLEEHDAIFRLPRQESYQLFESLRNRHIIEPVCKPDGDEPESEIVEGLQYRIRPPLAGAIIDHLQNRNIVH